MNEKTPRAVIYCRVSTDIQTENSSLGAQFVSCQKKATEIGAEVVGHFEETVSGGLYLARPGIQKALELIESGGADTLLVAKLDRAGRDVDNLRAIQKRVEAAGARLIFADGLNFERTPIGRLLFTQLGGFAEFERELIRERTVRGSRALATRGIMPNRARRPYGYRFVTAADVAAGTHAAAEVGRYLIVEDEARRVAWMYEQYNAGRSLTGLAAQLHEQGVSTPHGAPFWRITGIRVMLMNPLYKGQAAFGKYEHGSDETRLARGYAPKFRRRRPPEEWLYFEAPAIVSAEVWKAAQERLKEGRAVRSGRPDRRVLLTGLARCPTCGCALRFTTMPSRTAGGPRRSPAYSCTRKLAPDVYPRRCPNSYYRATTVDEAVLRGVVALLHQPALFEAALQRFDQAQASERASRPNRDGEEKRLRSQLEKTTRLIEAAAQGELEARAEGRDTRIYKENLSRLDAQRTQWETQLRQFEDAILARQDAGAQVAGIFQPGNQIEVVLQAPDDEITPAQKNTVLMQIIERVTPRPDGCLIVLRTGTPCLEFRCLVRGDDVTLEIHPTDSL